jgi:signal transduction histidine kinase
LRVALAAVAGVVTVAALLAIRDTTTWRTTYAGAAPEAAIADLAAGIGLIVAGMYVGADRAGRRLGVLLLLTGSAWLSADLVGWQGQSMHVRMLATAGSALLLPLLLHVVVVAPGGRTMSRWLTVVIGLSYVLVAAISLALVFTRDPLVDVTCWNLCSANPFLLAERPDLASAVTMTADLVTVLGGILIVLAASWRLASASPLGRRALAFVLVPGLLVGSLIAIGGIVRAWYGAAGPSDPAAMLLYQLSAWAIAALAAGVSVLVRRGRRARAAIQALAATGNDGNVRRSATDVLIGATGDRSLRIAYRLPASRHFVDATGATVPRPDAVAGRAVTPVTRGGDEIAVIDHDPERFTAAELVDLLGPAARLTLENERLDAQLLAQLRELRESRARIVAAGDRERRRRERDLHDGAQQRLLALTYDLRAARALAGDTAEPSVSEHLDAAIHAVHAAHEELRELAHGIYPAVLTEAGLARALESLVERAPIATRLEAEGLARCDPDAEMTAYVVADELLRDAARRGAGRARLQVSTMGDLLVLESHDDGWSPDGPIVHGQDRAGAAGGRLTLEKRVDADVIIRLEVPCASS